MTGYKDQWGRHLVDGISDIFLLVLVVKTLSPAVGSSEAQLSISDTERVPQRGLVPQPGVEDTLHRVAGHVRGRKGQETWTKIEEMLLALKQ